MEFHNRVKNPRALVAALLALLATSQLLLHRTAHSSMHFWVGFLVGLLLVFAIYSFVGTCFPRPRGEN